MQLNQPNDAIYDNHIIQTNDEARTPLLFVVGIHNKFVWERWFCNQETKNRKKAKENIKSPTAVSLNAL